MPASAAVEPQTRTQPGLFQPDPFELVNDTEERELSPVEEKALVETAAAGRRAAEWIRGLPLPDGAWIRGPLAGAMEEAMSSLDPADRDDATRYGQGGMSDAARERLADSSTTPPT